MSSPSTKVGAREFIDAVAEPDSWRSWDTPAVQHTTDTDYLRQLADAAERSGCDEAVLTGTASIAGNPVVLLVGEMRFLGGSIGGAAADRIVAAVRRATRERLPVVAATASGGTRMQEGTPAFLRMIDITRAVLDHQAAGLPYLVHLRNPTTGGVFASWGSLGQHTSAEPGALIGFLGPVVYQALHGQPFPDGVQTAENLLAHGIIDEIADLDQVRHTVERIVSQVGARPAALAPAPSVRPPAWDTAVPALSQAMRAADAWQAICTSRRPDRPGLRELLRTVAGEGATWAGTHAGERSAAVTVTLATFGATPCLVVGQDRAAQQEGQLVDPAALRTARRAMALAEQLRIPLVTVIDTPGGELSPAAEQGAIAGEIGRCLADLITSTVPTVSVLMGQGCGGAALALFPAARVVAAENAWLAPLPPEGASAIMYRDTEHAAQVARAQHVRAADLAALGAVHAVVPETPDATADPIGFCRRLADEIEQQVLAQLPA